MNTKEALQSQLAQLVDDVENDKKFIDYYKNLEYPMVHDIRHYGESIGRVCRNESLIADIRADLLVMR